MYPRVRGSLDIVKDGIDDGVSNDEATLVSEHLEGLLPTVILTNAACPTPTERGVMVSKVHHAVIDSCTAGPDLSRVALY